MRPLAGRKEVRIAMTSALAVEVKAAKDRNGTVRNAEGIDAKFHRLLETDRNSAEFADLWYEVDTYISTELEKQRAG